MVAGALLIAKVRETSSAGAKASLPAWWAVMVHEPAALSDTLEPTTAQPPAAVKFTGRPELVEALTANNGSPKTLSPIGSKVMVCATATAWAEPAAQRTAFR